MKARFLALLAALCLLFAACSPVREEEAKYCRVVLAESEAYYCEEGVKTVLRGSDAAFTLHVYNGYRFRSADYRDYDADVTEEKTGESTVLLTLKGVRYSSYVEIGTDNVKRTFLVTLMPSEYFRCENGECAVLEGESAVFTLYFRKDYTFGSVDYTGGFRVDGADSSADDNGERRVQLTLDNITEDISVSVKEREALSEGEIQLFPVAGSAVLGYALNGGRFKDGRGGSYFTETDRRAHGMRPNTSIGTEIERSGYVLTGWNTSSKGDGTHVGLGSRADVAVGDTLLLYAEWAKEADPALFDYVLIDATGISQLYSAGGNKREKIKELSENAQSEDKRAVITKFRGSGAETLVLPSELGGCPVAVAAPETLVSDETVKKVVFPNTVRYIMERSFISCPSLTEIVISDNLHYIDYNAFGSESTVSTVRINAATPPLNGSNESAQLANKLELLMQSEGDRTVFFGSCATWYGLNAGYFGEQTGRTSYNLAVEGDTCILFQLDILEQYLHEGDTLVYICDLGSPYLMLYDVSLDQRALRMVEFNYDLLATVDIRRYDGMIAAINEYLVTKYLRLGAGASGSYSDYIDYMTDLGDMGKYRPGPIDDTTIYQPRDLSEIMGRGAFGYTRLMLEHFLGMGLDVYYGFGPICEEAMTAPTLTNALQTSRRFEEEFESMPVPLVHTAADVIWHREDFFDQPYRLDTEASLRYTDIYISFFKER